MPKKRIWIINHYGGKRHDTFARYLVAEGYEVYLIRSSFLHSRRQQRLEKGEKYTVSDREGAQQILIKTLPYRQNGVKRFLNMASYYFQLLRLYKKFPRPDIIIASSPHPLALMAGLKIAKQYQVEMIMEIRDLWPQTFVDMQAMKENSLFAKFLYRIEKHAAERSDKIITLLEGVKDYFQKRGIDTEKLVHIPNGIDIQEFDQASKEADIKVEDFLDLNKFNAIYAGAHGRANNLDNIIRAAKIIQDQGLTDIHFNFFGDGAEKKNYIRLAEELALENLTFHDKVTKLELARIIIHCDLNLFNLENLDVFKYGISSNKLFDYMASKKPIIFSCNASNNFIDEANCGISVEPENPRAFAQAVIDIYHLTPSSREQMGLRGRKYLEKHFDYPQITKKLISILD